MEIHTLLGKPISHFIHVDHILERNGIRDADELERRLGPSRKYMPVFDAGNHKRLLGTLHDVPPMRAPRYTYPLPMRTSVSATFDPTLPIELPRVDFNVEWQTSEDGFTRHAIFTTYAPLKQLMQLWQFTLPGEHRLDAARRRYTVGDY